MSENNGSAPRRRWVGDVLAVLLALVVWYVFNQLLGTGMLGFCGGVILVIAVVAVGVLRALHSGRSSDD